MVSTMFFDSAISAGVMLFILTYQQSNQHQYCIQTFLAVNHIPFKSTAKYSVWSISRRNPRLETVYMSMSM